PRARYLRIEPRRRRRPSRAQWRLWESASSASAQLGTSPIEPVLSGLKTLETRGLCRQIDFLPFWIESGRAQFVDPAEKLVHELGNPSVAWRVNVPIVGCQNGGYRDRGDAAVVGNQIGIVGRAKRSGHIVVGEFLTKFDRQEFESVIPFSLDERIHRL